ncbi:uncharacterized protein LOC8055727 [Sorghum bicolor]|uniref:DUF1618 domain-containing protein n=1 Tax=Sorghum bicolor TaxID=4558 RepID=C5YUL4_SORBI|nr:uncharacterized protein LOC8055727 [Sorghum bicolor]EES17861.1 hypothetical protein SORBI_3009G074900 [Sorghum bicolor]|eukprot:XP_002439431.1 uncharacterized protein LOC8055727 [Sorghum bicolor]
MSSLLAPDVAESSRADQQAEQEPESEPQQRQRKWVALVSAAVLLGNEDERAQEIAVGSDVLFDLHDPALPSYLVLHPRIAPDPRRNDGPLSAYILAADRSACILVQVVEGNQPDFFLCNTHRRTVTILPPVPSYIQARGDPIRPRLSIGLIADPHHHGHYVVVQFHPATSVDQLNRILFYSTAHGRWLIRGLNMPQARRMRNPFSETGVLAHDGRLWWIALAYGVFFCDPCAPRFECPELRFLPLPDDCEMEGDVAFDPRIKTLIDQRRCVRLSEGKLRFVEIRGLSYDELVDVPAAAANPTVRMWTLDDPEGPDPWTFEYEVAFAEIWENKTYTDAGLLPDEVPHVALVDPNNHFVVYFFQGSKLFGFDMREKNVVGCKECLIDRDQLRFQSSRPIVDAWELPPPPPTLPGEDSSSPDDKVWSRQSYAEEMKSQVTESVDSWLTQARLEWTRDTDASEENWRAWKMAPPTSDESSANSGGQADDEPEMQFPLSL